MRWLNEPAAACSQPEPMKRLLQAPITAITLGGIVFLVTMAALLKPALEARPHQPLEPPSNLPQKFWSETSPEVDLLLSELRREKEEFAKKKALLKELEIRLQAERAEINTITQQVHQMQLEFDAHVVRVTEAEAANLKKLAKVYANMTPAGASLILTEMEDASIVKILMFMKEGESAPLLEALAQAGDLQARRAAGISEQLRRGIADEPKQPL